MIQDKQSKMIFLARKVSIGFALSCVLSASVFAAEAPLISRFLPTKVDVSTEDLAGLQKDKIIVKFKEGTGVRGGAGDFFVKPESFFSTAFNLSGVELELVQLEDYMTLTGASFNNLFSLSEQALSQLKVTGEQRSGKELADLNLYFEIPMPSWLSDASIASFVNFINDLPSVEVAYIEAEASLAATDTPDFTSLQTYTAPAPYGLDIDYAHTVAGGFGENVTFIDIEGGWNETHEDFPELFYQNGTENNSPTWVNHGTAVVAIVGAPANGYGIDGIAPSALIGTESYTSGIATAITNAAQAAGEGGVILLELQISGPSTLQCQPAYPDNNCARYVPVEYTQSTFDAIQTVTANGVIVIEAAANGGVSLEDPALGDRFDRAVRDSGAIMVGAGYATSLGALNFSDFGERVDIHNWGHAVMTAGYGGHYSKAGDSSNEDFWYTSGFNGTSSASALTAGVATSLQGIALNLTGSFLTPDEMRTLLAQTGSPQTDDLERPIGPRPNMRAAIDSLNGVEPTCEDYNDTLDNHVLASRAYVEEETTCLFGVFFCTTTYEFFAVGSNTVLGTTGFTVVDLKTTIAGSYELGSCPVEDTTPPVISLNGSSPMNVTLGSTFVDPGASASDNVDGDVSANIITSGSVNTASLGSYTLTYNVSDAAGNAASEVSRTVNVVEGNVCVESTLSLHVTAARAYEQYTLYYATGTATYLGSTFNDANKVVALEEATPGNWSLVSSCN